MQDTAGPTSRKPNHAYGDRCLTCNARLGADCKYRWRQTANGYSCCCWFFPCCCRCPGEAGNKACTLGASGGEKVQIDNVTTTICTSKPKVDIRGPTTFIDDRAASSLKYGDEASRCRTTVAHSFQVPALLQFHPEPPVSEPRYLRFWRVGKRLNPFPLRSSLLRLLSERLLATFFPWTLSVASIFHS